MMITSTAFNQGGKIPNKYTCDGEDVNPYLQISDVPKNTQSLVLIMDDPDSPTGTWLHWSLWNISPEIQTIEEGSVPVGAVEGLNSFGNINYGGPCPGQGEHRYFFRLYALDTKLSLPKGSEREELEREMEGHVLVQAEMMGRYTRQ